MTDMVFSYPGGKYNQVDWILPKIPSHSCYVELFAGSATVLFNKEPSKVEIINDLDGDIVHFFEVLRDRKEELIEFLSSVPYSRELHEEWGKDFYDGLRHDDDVERAARFFYLRYTQFARKYSSYSGFRSSPNSRVATYFANGVDELEKFSERMRGVVVECKDYSEIIEHYDTGDTFFYIDPPYVSRGKDYYKHDSIDFQEFGDILSNTEGDWIVSIDEVIDPIEGFRVCTQEYKQELSGCAGTNETVRYEHLIMNFDESREGTFSQSNPASEVSW